MSRDRMNSSGYSGLSGVSKGGPTVIAALSKLKQEQDMVLR